MAAQGLKVIKTASGAAGAPDQGDRLAGDIRAMQDNSYDQRA